MTPTRSLWLLAGAVALLSPIRCDLTNTTPPDIEVTPTGPLVNGLAQVQPTAPGSVGGHVRYRVSVELEITNGTGVDIELQSMRINGEQVSSPDETWSIADGDSLTIQNCDCDEESGEPFISEAYYLENLDDRTLDIELEFDITTERLTLQAAAHINPGGPLRWIGHAGDLQANEFWYATSMHRWASQVFALDPSVVGWNGEDWDHHYPSSDRNLPESDRAYGKPIYAPFSGEVCYALNDHEEWSTLEMYQARLLDPDRTTWPKSPTLGGFHPGGNQIFITQERGTQTFVAAHLQRGSIPPELLTPGATITEGQYLGKIGYSGNTGGPHTHIHIKTVTPLTGPAAVPQDCDRGQYRPMVFEQTQSLPLIEARDLAGLDTMDEPASWFTLEGHAPSWDPDSPSLLFPSTTTPPFDRDATDNRQYLGVFREDRDTISLRVKRPGWDAFSSRYMELLDVGFRLREVETFVENGARQYIGLFIYDDGPNALLGHTGWEAFTAAWNEQLEAGMRLIDVDVYHAEGATHYIGVYEAGDDAQSLFGHSTYKDFINEWESRTGLGQVLVDVDVITVDNTPQFVSVYREGTGGHGVLVHEGWEALWSAYTEQVAQQRVLTDVEVWRDGSGALQYLSTYRGGDAESALVSLTSYDAFVQETERRGRDGLQLIDVVVEP